MTLSKFQPKRKGPENKTIQAIFFVNIQLQFKHKIDYSNKTNHIRADDSASEASVYNKYI